MPDPPPSKLGGLPGDYSSITEENNLWELGADGDAVLPKRDAPTADEPSPTVDLISLPQRENRRRSEVYLGIQTRGPVIGDGAQKMPERRIEMEFGALDELNESERVTASADAGSGASGVHTRSGRDEFVDGPDEETGEGLVPEGVDDHVAQKGSIQEMDSKPARTPVGMVEWIALGLLGILLAGLAGGAYFWSIRLLPEEVPRWKSVDFPVKGARIEIKHAVTYWREPVLEGPNKDSVRRGVRLIPVVEMDLSGGPAALRVIFRDDEGRSMGDPIFRSVSSSGKLALASTAGFDDPGMHAAYRTEDLEPWTVEISEASSVDAPGSEYAHILKMNISPELR